MNALRFSLTTLVAAVALTACARSGVDPELDDDGDGLSNAVEIAGWTVVVHGPDGTPESRDVFPRIDLSDADGDGLDDAQEQALRLDPNAADTDEDGLDDRFEVMILGSRADRVDSDGDAAGDPRFFDRGEVEIIGSSPALADTDGDGFDDRYEVDALRTDPRIADLPALEVSVQAVPEIGLNTVLTTGEQEVVSVGDSVTRTVSMSHGDSRTTSESFSLGVSFGIEAGWSGGIHVVASFETTMTTTREVSLTLSREYTEAASSQVSRTRQRAESRDLTFQSGYVAFPVRLANQGPVAFTLKNASMTLFHRDPKNPWLRRALALVKPNDGRTTFPARSLGPGEAHDDVYFRSDELGWDDAIALMKDPRGLELTVSGYELVDADGRAFAHDATVRRTRTATLVIDHGPGFDTAEPFTRAVLATNLRLDPGTGAPQGLALSTAIEEWLGRSFETRVVTDADGRQVTVFAAVDGHRAEGSIHEAAAPSRWSVVRVRDGVGEVLQTDVDGLRLMAGDAIHLIYDEDHDADGLVARVEARLGTSDEEVDTDGDGLSDAAEVLHGWSPADPQPTHAISDPTRADTDGDGVDDGHEVLRGTDAFHPDSDRDGLGDAIDRSPLDPDRYALEERDARPVDDGAAIELTWAAVDNPAVERIHVLRQPIGPIGTRAEVPDDTLAYDLDALADAVRADAVFSLDPGETRLVDQPSAEAETWRYMSFVQYADVGLLPAGDWLIEHAQVVRYDRVRVRLDRLENLGEDDCEVHWEMSAAPGDGYAELQRRTFRLGPDSPIEIEEDTVIHLDDRQLASDERQADLILPRDGTGLTVLARFFRKDRRGPERLGALEIAHTRADAEAGGEHLMEFDLIDDPGECNIRVAYRLVVIEENVVDPGVAP